MPYLEVFPDKEYREDNPHFALVEDTGDDFEAGYVYIEPPLTQFSDKYTFHLHADVEVTIEHYVSTSQASLLEYCVEDSDLVTLANKDRIVSTITSLLNDLGRISSAQAFRNYTNYANNRERN